MPQASEHRLGRARDPTVVTAQPKSASKLPGRALSQERHSFTSAPNGFSPAPKLRLLPPRPGTLEERSKKSDPERGRATKRGSTCRRGPLKADHGVRVPGSPQAGTAPGGASFSLPIGTERRRSNLSRSKSVSIGDLSGEDVAAALSRLVLRDGGQPLSAGALALKRSSSLRRVNVGAGLDGRSAAPLLSVRHEGCARTRVPDPPDGPAPRSPTLGRAPEEKVAATPHHALLLGSGHVGLRNLGNTVSKGRSEGFLLGSFWLPVPTASTRLSLVPPSLPPCAPHPHVPIHSNPTPLCPPSPYLPAHPPAVPMPGIPQVTAPHLHPSPCTSVPSIPKTPPVCDSHHPTSSSFAAPHPHNPVVPMTSHPNPTPHIPSPCPRIPTPRISDPHTCDPH
ncbi:ubiquitin carboxyl-terminal hydrolase 21-like [Lagopus leucura]|uniref:ubiquitin carboxyl-terminal hydrolase 21-like n=1 Tax=Lagopus leucura TaxID=30410 RepID=UPI001C66691D|nr:ubiquitin carboxyl-terminal hydrolase 21-like [Lagopus leucura]